MCTPATRWNWTRRSKRTKQFDRSFDGSEGRANLPFFFCKDRASRDGRARKVWTLRGGTNRLCCLGKAALQDVHTEKVSVLGFRIHIPGVSTNCSFEYSAYNSSEYSASSSSTLRSSAFPACPHAIYNLGRRLRSGLVDRLEGKAIGEGLGNCRKPVLYSGFALANHFFLAIRLGRRRGRVD